MAIEDAVVAAQCLARMPDDAAGALQSYSAVRRGAHPQSAAPGRAQRRALSPRRCAGYAAQRGDARHGRRAAAAALRLALRLAAARGLVDQLSGATTMPATEPLFPTTIAGSLPKPAWLAVPNKLWAPWRLEGDELATAKDDATLLAIKLQEDAGIDIVGDGEQSRQHFVHGFLEAVDGIDFDKRVEMGIRNDRYKAMCPTVVGPLRLRSRVHAREARLARAHTKRKLKFTLPGPMTIVDTIADAHYGDRVKMALAFADAPQRGSARTCRRRRRRHPVRRAGVQRLYGCRRRLGHRGAAPRHRRRRLQERRAYLLRLRHPRQYRVEGDARRRMAAIREILPRAGQKPHRSGFARMHQFARADERHEAACTARTC